MPESNKKNQNVHIRHHLCRIAHGYRGMIAGLPTESWLLLLFSVGLPLYIVLRFFISHRRKPGGGGGGEP